MFCVCVSRSKVKMVKMSSMLLLCVVTYIFIHQTSPLPTGDSDQQQNDATDDRERTEQVLGQLVAANSQLLTAVYELQAEFAELKTAIHPRPITGK